jgi:type IV secretion system protein VirB10
LTDSSPSPQPDDAATPSEPTAAKAPPETLVLRAAPRRVVRFRRSVIVGGAAAGSVAIAAMAWMALGPQAFHVARTPDAPPVQSDQRRNAEAVADLPTDYSQVPAGTPILGPPLPGDLGHAIVDHQRQLGNSSAIPPNGAEGGNAQTVEAERQRLDAQATQAREAGLIVQSSGHTASAAASTVVSGAGASPGGGEPSAAGKLALDPDRDQNDQQRKLDFVGQSAANDIYNAHTLRTPASPYQVMAGSLIAASLMTGIDSDLPGMVIAQVTENVYDTVTGRILLIPQGARLIGSYDSVVAFGQSRALLVWQRIILPDGASIQIDNLPATDPAGYSGLSDKVDYHTWRLLKGVVLSTLLGVGTELAADDESDLVRAIRQSTQQSAAQAGQQIVTKQLNVQPTIRVRPGWPLRVVVHKDLVLRPWVNR